MKENENLISKIKELQDVIRAAFPDGGVSVSVVGLDGQDQDQTTNTPTEYVEQMTEKEPVLPINEDTTTIEDIKKLLNGYASEHGADKAFAMVEKLTGGSKNPADIPKDKYSYVVQACIADRKENGKA